MSTGVFICISFLCVSQLLLSLSVMHLSEKVAKNTAMRRAILHVICGKKEEECD